MASAGKLSEADADKVQNNTLQEKANLSREGPARARRRAGSLWLPAHKAQPFPFSLGLPCSLGLQVKSEAGQGSEIIPSHFQIPNAENV